MIRPVTPGVRWLLVVASGLVLLAAFLLFVLSEATDRLFAWTINPPLTAAFLGGMYLASFPLVLLSSGRRDWASARMAFPGVLVFTTVTLVATLIHIDRFHFSSAEPVAQVAAWIWLAVYALLPGVMAILLVRQLRVPGDDPPRRAPLHRPARIALGVLAAITAVVGVLLFVAPSTSEALWPWALSALTARAVAAWLLGVAVAAAQAIVEGDLERLRPAAATAVAVGVLQLIAVARYGGTVEWPRPSAWVFVALAAGFVVLGAYGWLARQPGRDAAPVA